MVGAPPRTAYTMRYCPVTRELCEHSVVNPVRDDFACIFTGKKELSARLARCPKKEKKA